MADQLNAAFTRDEFNELKEILGVDDGAKITSKMILKALRIFKIAVSDDIDANLSLSMAAQGNDNPLVRDAERRAKEQALLQGASHV